MTTSSTAETGRSRRSKLSWRLAAIAAVASLALTGCSGPGSDTTELVIYVVSEDPVFIEGAAAGTTLGDVRHRSYESYATEEQARAGEDPLSINWTTVATVVDDGKRHRPLVLLGLFFAGGSHTLDVVEGECRFLNHVGQSSREQNGAL
jgi:hypothetical protein